MPITESQLRPWIGEQVHWSRFFPAWLVKIYRAGLAEGHSPQQLEPLLEQLDQELSEGHPEMLMRTLPDLPVFTRPDRQVIDMMKYVQRCDDFDTSVVLLAENERFAAQLWQALLREVAHIEGFDPSFFIRHVELDEGEHAVGVASLLELAGNPSMPGSVRHFRTQRMNHLRQHFGDQVDAWYDWHAM